jgi:hypothetical protein
MMYERQFTVQELGTGHDRDAIKRAVEQRMKPAKTDVARDYLWGRSGDTVVVRIGAARRGFKPVTLPQPETVISFHLHAAPKRGYHNTHDRWRSSSRRSMFREVSIEQWARVKLHEAGLHVLNMEAMQFDSKIGDRVGLYCGVVTGEATVIDPEHLAANLLCGIPAAGPRCWGFGTLIIS